MKKCKTEGCNNKADRGNYCYKCISRKRAKAHPMKYTYNNLKNNARNRGKEFNLTFQQFKDFCIKTDYMQNKGITKTSYHIDRIDETKGYTIDNIQVLTNTENVKKYVEWVGRDENKVSKFTTKTIIRRDENVTDCLF